MNNELLDKIAKHIKNSNVLKGYKGKGDPVEYETAYTICEIVESSSKLVELFKELQRDTDPEMHECTLENFREEIRHILYHIKDTEYFSIVDGTV